MSEDEMYEGIEEIVGEYIKKGMDLKEIHQEVYGSFKTVEDMTVEEFCQPLRDGEDPHSETMREKLNDCMLMSGQRLGMEKILMINDAYERLTKSDEDTFDE